MKFLCVACDEPMKLDRTASPDRGGSITAVFECPECFTQVAMLTNPAETEVVSSLGVQLGGEEGSRCPFAGVVREVQAEAEAAPEGVSWTAEALARLENIPAFVRPMAKQGIEQFARSQGVGVVDEAVLDQARGKFGM